MASWSRSSQHSEFLPSRYDKPPCSNDFTKVSSSSSSVPAWEKRFCTSVCSIPWWKIWYAKFLVSSNSMHKNVAAWDDSAALEAFHNAKARFHAELTNGGATTSDFPLPDPDMYIDNVDYVEKKTMVVTGWGGDAEWWDCCKPADLGGGIDTNRSGLMRNSRKRDRSQPGFRSLKRQRLDHYHQLNDNSHWLYHKKPLVAL